MAASKGEVTIRGRFPAGTSVKLIPAQSADAYVGDGSGSAAATAKTNRDGETTFSAPPGRYFAVAKVKDWNVVLGEHTDIVRAVDVTIADPEELRQNAPPHLVGGPVVGPEPPAAHFLDNAQIVVGARSSADGNATIDRAMLVDERTGMVSEFASPVVGQETPKGDIPKDGVAPAPRLEDHRDEELASSTLTGEAVPPQPQPPKQEDAPKGMKQASDTEEGVQAPAREVVRQEDHTGAPQASDTETGTAFPVDPNQVTRSASGTGRQVQTGSSKPARGTREAQGRSGAKTTAKKAAGHQRKANESKQAKAARKASGEGTRSQPAEDARGVEHREVPENVRSSGQRGARKAARKGGRKAARKR
jgi:hypothetical protein